MSTHKKKMNQKQFLKRRLEKVNRALEKFEGEVERSVKKLVRQGEKSSRVLKKNFDEIVEKIGTSGFYSVASEKKEELQKEITRLADDVVTRIKRFDLKVANDLLNDVRSNIDQVIEKLQHTGIVEIAKDKAATTRTQVLHVLKIPSQDEVTKLSQKVNTLEKKLKVLSSKKNKEAA